MTSASRGLLLSAFLLAFLGTASLPEAAAGDFKLEEGYTLLFNGHSAPTPPAESP